MFSLHGYVVNKGLQRWLHSGFPKSFPSGDSPLGKQLQYCTVCARHNCCLPRHILGGFGFFPAASKKVHENFPFTCRDIFQLAKQKPLYMGKLSAKADMQHCPQVGFPAILLLKGPSITIWLPCKIYCSAGIFLWWQKSSILLHFFFILHFPSRSLSFHHRILTSVLSD